MEQPKTHAALMNSVYRRQRYIYDLTRKYYLFGRDRLIDTLAPKPAARIVEVGSGTARNLIRLARRYPDAKLFGLDASEAMLATAAQSIAKAGLTRRVVLAHGYAENLCPDLFGETALFDDIIFSYSLSMIPDWKQALRAAKSALSAGGRLHIVDFGDLATMLSPVRATMLAWLGLFHVSPRMVLLRTIETASAKCERLQILFGRYAFIFSCTGEHFPEVLEDVAAGSQAPTE